MKEWGAPDPAQVKVAVVPNAGPDYTLSFNTCPPVRSAGAGVRERCLNGAGRARAADLG